MRDDYLLHWFDEESQQYIKNIYDLSDPGYWHSEGGYFAFEVDDGVECVTYAIDFTGNWTSERDRYHILSFADYDQKMYARLAVNKQEKPLLVFKTSACEYPSFKKQINLKQLFNSIYAWDKEPVHKRGGGSAHLCD